MGRKTHEQRIADLEEVVKSQQMIIGKLIGVCAHQDHQIMYSAGLDCYSDHDSHQKNRATLISIIEENNFETQNEELESLKKAQECYKCETTA